MTKRLLIYLVLVTWIFAKMDWMPIHRSYLQHNDWPHASVDGWWPRWSAVRYWSALIICPPCAAAAEHYYFVLFEVEAGLAERDDLLLKHIPDGYEYEGVLSLHGFWLGQGGEDNGNPWKHVSLLTWWLYWLPYTIIWWFVYARDLFAWRVPGWVLWMMKKLR